MPKLIRKGEFGLNFTPQLISQFTNNRFKPINKVTQESQYQNQEPINPTNLFFNQMNNGIVTPSTIDRMDKQQKNEELKSQVSMPQIDTSLLTKPPADIELDNTPSEVIEKKSVADKFQSSTFGKNFEGQTAAANAANQLMTGIVGDKMFGGPKGHLTQAIDQGWDTISDVAAKFGPYGQMVSLGMKGLNVLNKGVNAALGSKALDNMTTVDAVLNNPLLGWNVGLINALGGQAADTITKNEDVFAQVGSAYGGSNSMVDNALEFSGKRYGAFSSGARKDANALIAESRRQQNMLEDISDEATIRKNLTSSMSAINSNRRALALQGGYNQSAVRFGRHGMILQNLKISKQIVSKFQNGGKNSDPFELYLQTLPEEQKSSDNFRVRDYWEFNGRPKDFDEAISKGMFTQHKDGWHAKSVAENPKTGEIEYMKSSNHPTRYMESDWYEKGLVYDEDKNGNIISIKLSPGVDGYDDWLNFTKNYELQKTEPYWKYVKRKNTSSPQSFKQGGNFTTWLLEVTEIPDEFKEYTINEISVENILPEFKEGGKFNVIPEGALHARKHNMDVEGITKKGIPVVSESEGGEIEQQAEIEREELILRLEVTKKIEELAKDGSDKAAIEAGKLLVEEILYNTIDNTNSLINGY